jgi:hypothetical protein
MTLANEGIIKPSISESVNFIAGSMTYIGCITFINVSCETVFLHVSAMAYCYEF